MLSKQEENIINIIISPIYDKNMLRIGDTLISYNDNPWKIKEVTDEYIYIFPYFGGCLYPITLDLCSKYFVKIIDIK